MTLRHAAALALVGWYLMMPPYTGRHLSVEAPLSKWLIYTSTDSAAECVDLQMATVKLLDGKQITDRNGVITDKGSKAIALDFALRHAQCVATDDPRLKGN